MLDARLLATIVRLNCGTAYDGMRGKEFSDLYHTQHVQRVSQPVLRASGSWQSKVCNYGPIVPRILPNMASVDHAFPTRFVCPNTASR